MSEYETENATRDANAFASLFLAFPNAKRMRALGWKKEKSGMEMEGKSRVLAGWLLCCDDENAANEEGFLSSLHILCSFAPHAYVERIGDSVYDFLNVMAS
jgi:hypothetical protein